MGQILIRQIDDADLDRLRTRAKAQRTSVEALAREAIRREARLTATEKRALVSEMWAATDALKIEGVRQTPAWELIREGRDADDR
ncbi:hypothetical protein [Sandaracinobacteroides saxicola]|uniref:Uncharacterized protein n=1 Tax=Sandaracinobacteroides saxicola TaxID=2759707 RepID=A0A7G5IL24_9SPHN|nr:hypothetical protein [Sandaracinobacteroides saxicola]QMW24066.1 hypothetical protein H3309_06285 [Sandaracinobacteroides saxicola]